MLPALRPPRQIEPDILVHQKGDPRGRQHADHAGHHAPVEPPDALLAPQLPDDAADALPELLLGIALLQPAAQHLERVRRRAGDELGHGRQHQRRLVGEHDLPIAISVAAAVTAAIPASTRRPAVRRLPHPPLLPRQVHPARGVVDGELHGAVADGEHADGEAAVEAEGPLLAQQGGGAGPHGRVGAGGGAVGREHAGLEDPDGVRDELGEGAGGERGGEEVGGGEAVLLVVGGGVGGRASEVGDGALDARLEEEEGRPAGRVAEQVRGQAAVEGGERAVGADEGADQRDGGQVGRGGDGAAVDWEEKASARDIPGEEAAGEKGWLRTLHACLDDIERVHC